MSWMWVSPTIAKAVRPGLMPLGWSAQGVRISANVTGGQSCRCGLAAECAPRRTRFGAGRVRTKLSVYRL